MVIKYSSKRGSLKIFSEAKVLSSHFLIWFLKKLVDEFDLYEDSRDGIRLLNHAVIDDSAELSESDIIAHKRCYKLDRIDKHFSFEEFLEIVRVGFDHVYVYTKGNLVDQIDFKNDKRILAIIDLDADGDTDKIWIGNINTEVDLLMQNLIDEYNSNKSKSD